MKITKFFLLLLLLIPNYALANTSNIFENKTFGLKLVKPDDWQFLTAQQHYEGLKRLEMDDKEMQKLIVQKSNAPLVIITKYPEPHDDLNPSFKMNVRPIGNSQNFDSIKTLETITVGIKKMFKDLKIDQKPTNVTISGIESAYMRVSYTLNTENGGSFAATSEMWVVPRDNYFFMIGAGIRQDEKNGSRNEIKKIIDSINIE